MNEINENNDICEEKEDKKVIKGSGLALWIALGLVFGVTFKNIGIGLGLGIAIGVVLEGRKTKRDDED